MEKIEININPTVEFDKAQSSRISESPNKMLISFPLLRTYPIVNANGDSFDFESTKELYDTVDFGYINLEHEQWINVGTVISSNFVEEEGYGTIKCQAVLWKNTLEEYGISQQDIKEKKYQISMEVYFNDYYVMHGDRKINLPDASDYLELKGDTFEGKEVARVIKPSEYSGAALTENAADKSLDIEKAVAKKLKKKKEVAMLSEARTPSYEGTETTMWEDVDKNLDAIIQGYYGQNPSAEPESQEEIPGQVEEMNATMKNWAANLSLLGDSDAETFDDLVVLPVVNPSTHNLNREALTAAARLSPQISGISDSTLESVQNKIDSLIEKEFNEEESANMFKEFETEEEYNSFVSELKEEAREGYVEVDEVLASIDEDVEDVEDVVDNYKQLKEQFASYKEEVARKEKLQERKDVLDEKGIDIDKLEASEEDIVEMSDKSFELIVKSFEQATEKMIEKASENGKFDPTKLDISDDEDKVSKKDILKSL